MQLLRAEVRTNHFLRKGDTKMVTFWSRLYYHLRRKVHAMERRRT